MSENQNTLKVKFSCFQQGYVFGPGTLVKRNSDGAEFLLAGMMADWRNEGQVLYMGFTVPTLGLETQQDWISETMLMEGKNYTILREVLASNIHQQDEASGD